MLLAKPDLVLRMGDRLIAVGRKHDIEKVGALLGNAVKNLREPNLVSICTGFGITVIPVLVIGFISTKALHMDFGTVSGMLCGSMSNPMALTYATDNTKNNHAAVSYTQVYPFSMFLRVIIAQLVLVFLL